MKRLSTGAALVGFALVACQTAQTQSEPQVIVVPPDEMSRDPSPGQACFREAVDLADRAATDGRLCQPSAVIARSGGPFAKVQLQFLQCGRSVYCHDL